MEKTHTPLEAFLLYTYFGITEKSTKEEFLVSAINRAYLDAASHVLRIAGGNEKFRKEGTDRIKQAIQNYPNSNNDFVGWHRSLCDTLVEFDASVTYGIAQKWVNMTTKYSWLLDVLPEEVKMYDLHIPIDSYIIDALKDKKNRLEYGLALNNKILSEKWSKFSDYSAYADLQLNAKEAIRNKFQLSPIEWEGKAWIEVAKKRSKK